LRGNSLGPEGGAAVAHAIGKSGSLRWINMPANQLGPEGGKALLDALKKNKTICELMILCNDIDTDCAKSLAELGKKKGINFTGIQPEQQSANFQAAGLKVADGILIAAALEEAQALTSLDLSGNELCGTREGKGQYKSDAMIALCSALGSGTSLKELNLSGNGVLEQTAGEFENIMWGRSLIL